MPPIFTNEPTVIEDDVYWYSSKKWFECAKDALSNEEIADKVILKLVDSIENRAITYKDLKEMKDDYFNLNIIDGMKCISLVYMLKYGMVYEAAKFYINDLDTVVRDEFIDVMECTAPEHFGNLEPEDEHAHI